METINFEIEWTNLVETYTQLSSKICIWQMETSFTTSIHCGNDVNDNGVNGLIELGFMPNHLTEISYSRNNKGNIFGKTFQT